MTNVRPSDSKREEFRKYLERAGVMDSLTKALIALYEEPQKPSDAVEYIRDNLGKVKDGSEVESLREEIARLKERIAQLEAGGSKISTPRHSEQSLHSGATTKTAGE